MSASSPSLVPTHTTDPSRFFRTWIAVFAGIAVAVPWLLMNEGHAVMQAAALPLGVAAGVLVQRHAGAVLTAVVVLTPPAIFIAGLVALIVR